MTEFKGVDPILADLANPAEPADTSATAVQTAEAATAKAKSKPSSRPRRAATAKNSESAGSIDISPENKKNTGKPKTRAAGKIDGSEAIQLGAEGSDAAASEASEPAKASPKRRNQRSAKSKEAEKSAEPAETATNLSKQQVDKPDSTSPKSPKSRRQTNAKAAQASQKTITAQTEQAVTAAFATPDEIGDSALTETPDSFGLLLPPEIRVHPISELPTSQIPADIKIPISKRNRSSKTTAGTDDTISASPSAINGMAESEPDAPASGSSLAFINNFAFDAFGIDPFAAAASEPSARIAPPADFPQGFNDASVEDFFASQSLEVEHGAGEDDAQKAEGGEKKRRHRSRRNRSRKKSAARQDEANAEVSQDSDELNGGAELDGSRNIADDELDDLPDDTPDDLSDDLLDDVSDAEDHAGSEKQTKRKMFVSVLPEEQVEVVITEEGQVQEYYVEMLHQAKTKGNIYKAVIHNVDPNLQAAFVNYGAVKNGFLQIDEIHPEYYVVPHDAGKGRKYPPIQKVVKAGQEILVQVVKEPAGTKGAFLTTYLSMPGRFLVLTPGREQIGVSRKVESESERARLRELLEGLSPGPGLGVIIRTVSMGVGKANLLRDLQYLKRTWQEVRGRGTSEKSPSLIYQEMDLTARAVRDYLTEAMTEVWIDDEKTAGIVAEIADALFPRKHNLVKTHKDHNSTLFERFGLQRQLDQIHSREVVLPSGGRLVIDPTEALTAIDINSGRSGGKNNFEDMAYRTNMEAAKMIPLQLRLRDIGGQVVADFIEMRDKSHWREVEKTFRNGMKVDRARYDVGRISSFGLLEIVRQRLGSSAISVSTEPCPCCNGTGVRRNMEWQSQQALRDLQRAIRQAQSQNQNELVYPAEHVLALHLLNNKRQRILEMEQSSGVKVEIQIQLPPAL